MLTISREVLRNQLLDHLSMMKLTVVPEKQLVKVQTGTDTTDKQMADLSARGFILTGMYETANAKGLIYEYAFGHNQEGVIQRQVGYAHQSILNTAKENNIPFKVID